TGPSTGGDRRGTRMSRRPAFADVCARLARASFADFVEQAWPLLEPARARIDAWHTQAISEHLEAVSRGQIKRLIICEPPGTGKSTLVGVAWPSWQWTNRPSWRLISASHAHTLATRDLMKERAVISSAWYRSSFVRHDWRLDVDRQDELSNTAGGRRLAV